MFTTLRKHQRWLMLVIAVLTIIAFAFLYNTTEMDRVGSNMVARIYGRDVMQVDIERAVRNYQLALALGQIGLVRDLAAQARSEDEAVDNFIWNLMVLQHEAAALGVEPGTQDVVNRIKTLPVFQSSGSFDPVKYAAFVQEQLGPRGFTERQLEAVVKDTLRLEGIKALVESPAALSREETKPALDRMAPVDVEVIRFDAASEAKDIKVGDDELKAAFEARKASLNKPEMRSVRYAAFVLTPSQKELKDKARVEALQKIATATSDFAQELSAGGKPLTDVARSKGTDVRTTPLFAPDGATGGALKDLEGEVVPAAAAVAFRLPAAAGAFEIVPLGDDGYAVIEVAEVQAARPMTFDEARADLRAELIAQKAGQAVRAAADKALGTLRAQLAAGKSFAEAAKAAGVKTAPMKGLSVFNEDLTPAQREVAAAVADVPAGMLGEFVPGPDGGFAAYVVSRGEPDPAAVARQLPMVEKGLLQRKKMLLFLQWLQSARQASGLVMLRGGGA